MDIFGVGAGCANDFGIRCGNPVAPQPVTVDSALGELLDNAAARAVLAQQAPAIVNSPQIDQARALSLRSIPTATDTAIIVAPGGGYQGLATGLEGRQVGDWFAAHVVAGFVLTYRQASFDYRHPTQLQDAQHAIRWVRAHAAELQNSMEVHGLFGVREKF